MRLIHTLLLLIIFPVCVLAQQTIAWSGVAGSAASKTFTIDPAWTGAPQVKAYHTLGGPLVSSLLQPTASLSGGTLLVTFSGTQTKALPRSVYIEILVGGTLRFKGFLLLTAVTSLSLIHI